MYIRSAEKDEDCKYVLIGNGGQVLKKYYDQDEPVDFKKEIAKHVPTVESRLAAAEQENQVLKQAVLELQEKLKQQDECWEPQYDVQKIQAKG
jgi:hypothetical protein